MKQFINFIIDLANEELYTHLDGDAQMYFLQGGCFEFAKILKQYVKNSRIVINKDFNHCGILHSGNVYDATGVVKEKNNFLIVKEEGLKYMETKFGLPEKQYIKGMKISEYLIKQLEECNINKIIERIEGEER